MVLRILEAVVTSPYFPSQYVIHIGVALLSLYILRIYSQGRKTDRERDLHARVILVTGGFTSTGLTLLQTLAERGAHVIALAPDDIEDTNGRVSILIELLRTTTSNEKIFAEQCDLTSPASIRSFCTRFLTGQEQRLDAIIFAHELEHIGSPAFLSTTKHSINEEYRDAGSLATFLITTLLLPALLVAPVERDIRIINVVNPFYAAAAGLPFSPSFPSISDSPDKIPSMLISEGRRSLQSIILNRHFQRVLDALPTGAQIPKTEEGTSAVPVVSSKHQKSNIVAVTVCPGFTRVDTIAPLLNADWTSRHGFSKLGVFIYILLHPLLRIFSKTPGSAMQTVLHALCLPTPFKILSQTSVNPGEKKETPSPVDTSQLDMPVEVLRPGALYRECAMVSLGVKISEELQQHEKDLMAERARARSGGKGKQKDSKSSAPLQEEVLDIADDGEYGGELAGRLVWEKYEESLKIWEKNHPAPAIPEPKPQPPKPKDPNASPY